jgi:hypothetical protein
MAGAPVRQSKGKGEGGSLVGAGRCQVEELREGFGRPATAGRGGGGSWSGSARAREGGGVWSGGPCLEEREGACGPHLENVGRPGRREMGRAQRNSESFDLFMDII